MKGIQMSGVDRLKPVGLAEKGSRLRSGWLSRIQTAALMLLAVAALAFLSGCATPAGAGGPDPTEYNPNTGYPAVGAGAPWHL